MCVGRGCCESMISSTSIPTVPEFQAGLRPSLVVGCFAALSSGLSASGDRTLGNGSPASQPDCIEK